MGYYTDYDLDILKCKKEDEDLLESEVFQIFFKDLTSYDIEDGLYGIKWYEHHEHMIKISKQWPDVIFELDGSGEDSSDIWRTYYHNGKSQHSPGKIIFDEFDENKLR